jgi:CO dehydrogenase/acetyl-CoA synthase alpha subunit
MLTYAGSRGDRKAAAPADDAGACGISMRVVQGTHFTFACLTGTKVQILTE